MNIFQKLAAITAELQTVAKNLSVDTGKGKSYKAVSERDIIDNVKPLEEKHGVYSYPVSRETLESERLETETQYGTKTTFYTRIKTVYRFVNVDEPTDFIETVTFSVGLDSGDKGDGKAMTYGDKYALMKAYKISTGDDPDAQASVDTNYHNVSRKTLLDQIYSLDITRKELDQTIQSKYPDKDADTLPIENLKALKAYFAKTRRNA
jgi:hypothetical protein